MTKLAIELKCLKKQYKNLRDLERVFPFIQQRSLLDETYRIRHKTSQVWFFPCEILPGFVRNSKIFRSEGFAAVSKGRTFLDFVDFVNCFFRHFNSIASFLTSTESFWQVQEKTIFLECSTGGFSTLINIRSHELDSNLTTF